MFSILLSSYFVLACTCVANASAGRMSTHAEIAEALTQLYQIFLKIGYIAERRDEMAPHSTQDLTLELCGRVGSSEEAIALLQQIPWTTSRAQLIVGASR